MISPFDISEVITLLVSLEASRSDLQSKKARLDDDLREVTTKLEQVNKTHDRCTLLLGEVALDGRR